MSDDPHSHSYGHSHAHPEKGVSRRKIFRAAAAFTPLALVGSSGADPLLARALKINVRARRSTVANRPA